MDKTKPYEISKHVVLEAYQRVKANKGAAGIDHESLESFEANLKDTEMHLCCYYRIIDSVFPMRFYISEQRYDVKSIRQHNSS